MVYKDQFVVVLVSNGKTLRETRKGQEDVILLPFNSEYGVKVKNLSSNRALVNLEIDGVNVLESGLVLASNESHVIEGFLENGVIRNKFRFIQKTKQIADYRGDFIEDGLVKVTYQFEKTYQAPCYTPPAWPQIQTPLPDRPSWEDWTSNIYGDRGSRTDVNNNCYPLRINSSLGNICGQSLKTFKGISDNVNMIIPDSESPALDEGITVKGSHTNIHYNSTILHELYPNINTIIFKIAGKTSNNTNVKRPLLVRSKIRCSICGTNNSSINSFCTQCGTALK